MRKYIIGFAIFLLVLSLGVTTLVAFEEAHKLNRKSTENYVRATSSWLITERRTGRGWDEVSGEISAVYDHLNIPIRVTVIDRGGNVLFDNEADKALENHIGRPEVKYVLEHGGTKEEVRFSDTLNQKLLYYATLLEDEDVVARVAIPLASEAKAIANLRFNLLLVSALTIVLFVLFSVIFVNRLTRPLEHMTDAVERLQQGDYSTRVRLRGRGYRELNRLAEAYNGMADTLQAQHTRLSDSQRFFDTLINSLSEPLAVCDYSGNVIFINTNAMEVFQRFIDPEDHPYPLALLVHDENLTREIMNALYSGRPAKIDTALETADGTKAFTLMISPFRRHQVVLVFHDRTEEAKAEQFRSEFVANVTHELRTPLTSIRGFIDTLQTNPDLDAERKARFLELMDLEAGRLERLIADLLSLSDIESGAERDDTSVFSLRSLTEEVVTQLGDYADERGIRIHTETDEAVSVEANRDRIKQVLINLLDNAIKYSYDDSDVWIGYRVDKNGADANTVTPHTVRLYVKDKGVGLKPEDQARIFERFYRVDKSRSKAAGGTGLGLSIVKHIARLYHGRVEVESQPGEGSVFTVTMRLPMICD